MNNQVPQNNGFNYPPQEQVNQPISPPPLTTFTNQSSPQYYDYNSNQAQIQQPYQQVQVPQYQQYQQYQQQNQYQQPVYVQQAPMPVQVVPIQPPPTYIIPQPQYTTINPNIHQALLNQPDIYSRSQFAMNITACWILQEVLLIIFSLCFAFNRQYHKSLNYYYGNYEFTPLWYSLLVITFVLLFITLITDKIRKGYIAVGWFLVQSITYAIVDSALQTDDYLYISMKGVYLFALSGLWFSIEKNFLVFENQHVFKSFGCAILGVVISGILCKQLFNAGADYIIYIALGQAISSLIFMAYYTCILNRILCGRFKLKQDEYTIASLMQFANMILPCVG